MVPVLSRMTVSMRYTASSASPPLIRMPRWAPRPVPTMMAVGVAKPSAQGQAIISTATKFTSANGNGLNASHTRNVTTAMASTPTVK